MNGTWRNIIIQRNKILVGLGWTWMIQVRFEWWTWPTQAERSTSQASKMGFSKCTSGKLTVREGIHWDKVPMKWVVRPGGKKKKKCCSSQESTLRLRHLTSSRLCSHWSLLVASDRLKECFMISLSAIWMMQWLQEKLDVGGIIKIKRFL